MKKDFLLFFLYALILFASVITAQSTGVDRPLPIINVTGQETGGINNTNLIRTTPQPLRIPDLYTEDLLFSFHPINYFNGYDFQTNSVPREIWQDPSDPAYVHSVMMFSQQAQLWSDRTCTYLLSTDYGETWTPIANVPSSGEKSGYPAISGMPDGRQVIADHDDAGGTTTHTKIYVADAPGSINFTSYDPGTVTDGDPIWPRFCVVSNDNILIASSIINSPSDNAFTINLNPVTGVFSGYTPFDGTQAECYSLAVSEDGSKTGHLYIANNSNPFDVFYRESSDGGSTWGMPVKIWDWTNADSLGCLRGVDLVFLNNQPCAVFEVDKVIENTYYYWVPSKIYFWSPGLNGGLAYPIAESGVNVPYYYPYQASNDILTPVCRPVIGRSSSGQSLFAAFMSVTGDVFGDSLVGLANSYYAGYFTYSTNAGEDWTQPVKFTPDSPLRDWRYISISPTNEVIGQDCIVQMFVQSDSVPGSNINAPFGYPVGVTAQMVGVTAEIQGIIPVELTNFKAEYIDNRIQLSWKTATEKNNFGFKILRSENAKEWKEIGFVEGNGTSAVPHSFQYIDNAIASGTIYYRLKQIDFDGTYNLLKIVSLNLNIPDELKLFQNYPNPFNPVTEIKFSIPEPGNVSLIVYDILGNEAAVLVNERREAGLNLAEFNAKNLASGIYIYRLNFNGTTESKKLLLLK